jgi:hypothetical protein
MAVPVQVAPVNLATKLLTVVGTLLPLLAIFLQIIRKYYEDLDDPQAAGIQEVVVGGLIGGIMLLFAGVSAAGVISSRASAQGIENTALFLQFAFLGIGGTLYFMSRGILEQMGVDTIISSPAEEEESEDDENDEPEEDEQDDDSADGTEDQSDEATQTDKRKGTQREPDAEENRP